MSHCFVRRQTAFRLISVLHLSIGFAVPLTLKTIVYGIFGCAHYHTTETLVSLIPLVSFFNGLFNIALEAMPPLPVNETVTPGNATAEGPVCVSWFKDPLPNAAALCVSALLFFVLTVIIDNRRLNRFRYSEHHAL